MCSLQWYPLSFYVLYVQLFRDGLLVTKWLYSDQPDEADAWAHVVIPDDVYPILSAQLAVFGAEIEKLLESPPRWET